MSINIYQCLISAPLIYNHVQKKSCQHKQKAHFPSPICNKTLPTPYIFLLCGHTITVICCQLHIYLKNPSWFVTEVSYNTSCRHCKNLKCSKAFEITTGLRHICTEEQWAVLPQCGHTIACPCHCSTGLNGQGEVCEEMGKVHEGEQYGPCDFPCLTMTYWYNIAATVWIFMQQSISES